MVSREWVSYVFDKYATKKNAILSVKNELIKHPEAIRCEVENRPRPTVR